MQPQTEFFDIEIVGTDRVEVLVQFLNDATGEVEPFWLGRMDEETSTRFYAKFDDPETLRIGFNSNKFDMPILGIILGGYSNRNVQEAAHELINAGTPHWQVLRDYGANPPDWNHIDLYEVAPGVQISLKTYAGRLAFPTMVEHTNFAKDLETQADFDEVAAYCANDLRVTQALYRALQTECELRTDMSFRFEMDLRSKSDAQIAEAVISKQLGLRGGKQRPPRYVRYTAPTNLIDLSGIHCPHRREQVQDVIDRFEAEYFTVNPENGAPIEPEWLKTPIQIGKHKYKFGLGGLHSVDDNKMYLVAGDGVRISDFDVGSYYPKIMMESGVIPNLGSHENGLRFMQIYTGFFDERMEHKHAKRKRLANSMKIFLNGTFGKLGSIYSPFYAPELMLAVTITGQLNLAILIAELEALQDVEVRSANTDGIVIQYPDIARESVFSVFEANSKRTSFEYEETVYSQYAARDVNNYIAIQPDGTVKRKGQYASSDPTLNALYLQKNPGMDAATNLAISILQECGNSRPEWGSLDDILTTDAWLRKRPMREFVAIQNVRGGGIQHTHEEWVDDWVQTKPREWVRQAHLDMEKPPAPTKRVSRPKPVKVYKGGACFGKVARWYMTTVVKPPITTLKGNKVPCTEGSQLLLTMPSDMAHPEDLDYAWYVDEALRILKDIGC